MVIAISKNRLLILYVIPNLNRLVQQSVSLRWLELYKLMKEEQSRHGIEYPKHNKGGSLFCLVFLLWVGRGLWEFLFWLVEQDRLKIVWLVELVRINCISYEF